MLALGLSLSSQFVFRAFGQEAGTPIVQTLRVGNSPTGLAFDGGNVWVVNDLDNNVGFIPSAPLLMAPISGSPTSETTPKVPIRVPSLA